MEVFIKAMLIYFIISIILVYTRKIIDKKYIERELKKPINLVSKSIYYIDKRYIVML